MLMNLELNKSPRGAKRYMMKKLLLSMLLPFLILPVWADGELDVHTITMGGANPSVTLTKVLRLYGHRSERSVRVTRDGLGRPFKVCILVDESDAKTKRLAAKQISGVLKVSIDDDDENESEDAEELGRAECELDDGPCEKQGFDMTYRKDGVVSSTNPFSITNDRLVIKSSTNTANSMFLQKDVAMAAFPATASLKLTDVKMSTSAGESGFGPTLSLNIAGPASASCLVEFIPFGTGQIFYFVKGLFSGLFGEIDNVGSPLRDYELVWSPPVGLNDTTGTCTFKIDGSVELTDSTRSAPGGPPGRINLEIRTNRTTTVDAEIIEIGEIEFDAGNGDGDDGGSDDDGED